MTRRSRLLASIAALALALASRGYAQVQPAAAPSTAPSTAPGSPQATLTADALLRGAKPENPYLRFEIVSLGAFPIMLFYSDFCFDLGRYYSSGLDPYYAPWPFKTSSSAPLTESDRVARIGAALGACAIVGGIDAYLHYLKLRKAQRLRQAIESDPLDRDGALPVDPPGLEP